MVAYIRILSPISPFESAARAEGWRLDADGAFRHNDEILDDGSPASFWYGGDWEILCSEAAIDVAG